MDIKIKLEIGLSPELAGFLERFLPKPSAAERFNQGMDQPHHGHGDEPEETMHAAAAQEPQETTSSPQPAKRRGRPPKSEAIDAAQATKSSGSPEQMESGDAAGSTATNGAAPATTDGEETLAEALGIEDGAIDKKALEDKLRETVDKVGNVKLIQETLFKATGFKGTGSMTEDKYADAFAALDGLMAAKAA